MKKKLIMSKALMMLLTSFGALSKEVNDNFPPILDYYPNCSYDIIETVSSKKTTLEPSSSKTTLQLLRQLQIKAKNVGASALILVNKKRIKSNDIHQAGRAKQSKAFYTVSFNAELIKSCKEKNSTAKKLTKYNHLGQRTVKSKGLVMSFKPIEIKYPEKAKLHRPQILNQEVSLENGLYGIKMGSEYEHILKTFGDPSIQVDLLKNELLVGYGRRHWLHFQAGKLVKVQSSSQFLTQTILNEVPFFDFFDDFSWRINNKFSRGDKLNKIKASLNIDTPLNVNNQLILNHQNNTLVLNFIYKKDSETLEKEYSLSSFEMYKSDYKIKDVNVSDSREKQNSIIAKTYRNLQQEIDIDWNNIEEQLGKPIGRITLTANSALIIYNSNLLVKIKNKELNTIQYIQAALLDNDVFFPESKPWTLDNFKQNISIEELRPYFQNGNSEYEGEVEIQADAFNLSLYFNTAETDSPLEEAKLIIY
jgi:hypothetical protein